MESSVQPQEQQSTGALFAAAGVALGVMLFAVTRLSVAGPSFDSLEAEAVSLDQALKNGRPTIMEFYADWCEICRSLVPVSMELEQQYKGQVNFSMLNVDNPKWSPEVAEYGVRGIPEFIFLDSNGEPKAAVVGRVPPEVLRADASALAAGVEDLPYAKITKTANTAEGLQQRSAIGRVAGPLDHS